MFFFCSGLSANKSLPYYGKFETLRLAILVFSLVANLEPSFPSINYHLSLGLVHLQLVLVMGLASEQGQSRMAAICRLQTIQTRKNNFLCCFRSRLLQTVGKYSTAVYLLHDPVFKILLLVIGLSLQLSTFLLASALTITLAVTLHSLIELPLQRWKNKYLLL